METTPLYLDESERQTFEATVVDTTADAVLLDRTAFYPKGGGQPHDTGELESADESWTVTDVTGRGEIWHSLTGETPAVETTVTGCLDWERRYAHMRYHTAQHLLSAVLLDAFDAETVGNQLYEDRARIDCAYERFERADLQTIESRLNTLVQEDIPVEWYELDRETAEAELDPTRTRLDLLPASVDPVRIVEIEEIDRTACGGTHVSRTGEIGEVTITGRETAGKGAERIRFTLAEAPTS